MATTYLDGAESAAQSLTAQQNATDGLKELVVAVRDYIVWCVGLLGSGEPQAAPSFSSLIGKSDDGKSYKSLTDTSNKAAMTTAYDGSVTHIKKVAEQLTADESTVGARVSDVADLANSTSKQIEGTIATLRGALGSPQLPAPPRHDYSAEGTMIDACLTAVDNVHTDLQNAHATIQKHAAQVADATSPAVPASGSTTEDIGGSPVTYGTPLSASQVQSMVSGVADATKKKFLSAALSEVGKPYVYGAEGPNAFDCSGLVQYSAEQAGIKNMPRTAAEQYDATKSHPVSASNLQPGDLIFPDAEFNNGNPGHVMIYVGNGKCVEAPHTGEDVKTISLSEVGGFHATSF